MITKNSLSDTLVDSLIQAELHRQKTQICLIPSENIASADIMKAQGSIFMNKYAEGYPTKRYYEGCEICDDVEQLAIDRACKIFNVKYANVQPHSGSQANQAVFVACLQPGDTILGMDLGSGGHLTHGFKNNMSGTYYNAVSYSVEPMSAMKFTNANDDMRVERCVCDKYEENVCSKKEMMLKYCNMHNSQCGKNDTNNMMCEDASLCVSNKCAMSDENDVMRADCMYKYHSNKCAMCDSLTNDAIEKCHSCCCVKICSMQADVCIYKCTMSDKNTDTSESVCDYCRYCDISEQINYDTVRALALQHRPKMIIAGGSSYSRNINWKKLRKIADEVNALLLADIAHTAGMIAAGQMYNPCNDVDIMTCTTHKTLRGPRGGLILTNHEDLIKKINRAIMPGIQGGPMIHTIAAKAVCFAEAMTEEYKTYAAQILLNAKKMCDVFQKRGLRIVTNGTDNHLMVIDVSVLGKTGQEIATLLAKHNIIVNKNAIPYDKMGVIKTSGIRMGSPFITSCDFDEQDSELLAEYVSDVICIGESTRDISGLFAKITKKYDAILNEMR